MLDGADNGRFGTIEDDLENKIMCSSDSYPKTKDNTVGLINNYYVSKQLTQATLVKEDVSFAQTKSNTNTIKTKKKG